MSSWYDLWAIEIREDFYAAFHTDVGFGVAL